MWPTVLITLLAFWLITALVLAVILWRRESAFQDAFLQLLGGIGGGAVLAVALVVELGSESTSNFEIALMVAGIMFFASAVVSGFRQLGSLRQEE